MFGPFLRKRTRERTPAERHEAAVRAVLGARDDLHAAAFADPTRPRPDPAADPAWVEPIRDGQAPPEARKYLELHQAELERYATLELLSPGPGLEEQVVDHAAGWVERLVLGPTRTLFTNLGWLLLTAATLVLVGLLAGNLLTFVVGLFGPVVR